MRMKIFKKGNALLSLLLLTAIVFPTVLVGSISASAAADDDYITIYFKNGGWDRVNVHFWSTPESITSTWPGIQITEQETTAYEKKDGDKTVVTKYNKTTDLYEVYLKKDYDWTGLVFDSLTSSSVSSKVGTNKTSDIDNLAINDGNTWIFSSSGGYWQEKRFTPMYIAGDSFSPNNWDEPFQQMIDGGDYYYYNSTVMKDGQSSVSFKIVDRNTWTNAVSPPTDTQYKSSKSVNATLTAPTSGTSWKAALTDTENYNRIQIRIDKETGDIYPVAMKAPSIETAPRIRYYVPYDSWQRDFTMTESDEYYSCTIPTVNAQVYVYDKNNGELSGAGYAGIDALEEEYVSRNVNVDFTSVDGSAYKNAEITSDNNSGEIEIRVDKATGLIYGVSGKESSPIYTDTLKINAKTETDTDFKSYDTITDDTSRYYSYIFDTYLLEMDFIYNDKSISDNLTFKITDSENKGINLYKKDGSNSYIAEIIDKENCDKIKVLIDKYTGAVYAEAVKSDIIPEENIAYYIEGRFICKDSDGNEISINNKSWSDTSSNISFTETEKTGVYKLVTNSTVSDLTSSNGAPYYFFVREGTKYPKSASGKLYSTSGNKDLKNTVPGEKIAVNKVNTAGGGLYFNDSTNNSGKVTIWFDISDNDNPFMYYTLRYNDISSKAMYSNGSDDFTDNDKISVSVNPNNNIELPSGAEVKAEKEVSEDGKEYTFIGWTTENGTGKFEDDSSPETIFYPTSDNETVIARYKVGYNLICESSAHGKLQTSSDKVGVGESYTIDIIPDDGYTLTSLTVNGEEKINDTIGRTQYTAEMPEQSVIVKATFDTANDVYFYAAVQTTWGDVHKNISVIADGEKLDPVKAFDKEITLYNKNSSSSVASGITFYVSLFKAEEHSKILIGNPENADGTIDNNCYGHKILSGELKAGSCYYYYSKSSGNNLKGIVEAVTVNAVSCTTEIPTQDVPVTLCVDIDDCNGKTAGQENYTVEYDVRDSKGNSYPVSNNTFTPETGGTYTVTAWAAYGEVKSNTAQCTINVQGDQPKPSEIIVEFKYYDRDSNNTMDISNTETTISVTETLSDNSLEKTLSNVYASVNDKLRKDMNLMCEYYFWLSQSSAVDEIKAQNNYHALKADENGNIIRDVYGIAQYKTYGECYTDEVLSYHTDCYGNTGNSEQWVTYYSDNEVIDQATAESDPNNVTKIVIWGFNNPRVYHIDMNFTADNNTGNVTCVDENNGLYVASGGSNYVVDAFYNMSLAANTDYTNGGYLSHFAISDYYGNEEMPTAVKKIITDSENYVFDGWYNSIDGDYVKVSSDLNFANRITSDLNVTAVYKTENNSDRNTAVTVTKSDIEKYTDNGTDKIRLNTVINVFDCENIENTAIIYVRLKSTENSDWENNYSSIDFTALRKDIIDVLSKENVSGRKISVITIGENDTAQIVADCYEVVSDENNVSEYKIVLNNKNRVMFSNSFTAQSGKDNGANSAILAFAAVNSGDEWILSDNYIPYINTGK